MFLHETKDANSFLASLEVPVSILLLIYDAILKEFDQSWNLVAYEGVLI